jgi:hypothetical protein
MLKRHLIAAGLMGVFSISVASAKELSCSAGIKTIKKNYNYEIIFVVNGVNDSKEFAKQANVQVLNAEGLPIYAKNVQINAYPGETFSKSFLASDQYIKFSEGATEKQKKAIKILTPINPTDEQKKAIKILMNVAPNKDEKDKVFANEVEGARKNLVGVTCKSNGFTR